MVAYSILLNLLLLIGVGCIVGILVVAIMVNMKLGTLIRNMSELNKNLSNIKINSSNNSNEANFSQNSNNQAQIQRSTVDTVTYKNSLNAHPASFKEEQLIQERINSLQKNDSINQVNKQNTEETKQKTEEIKQGVNQPNVTQQSMMQQNEPAAVGIVFCRNCASHFTSDKEACPICGAKRQ